MQVVEQFRASLSFVYKKDIVAYNSMYGLIYIDNKLFIMYIY